MYCDMTLITFRALSQGSSETSGIGDVGGCEVSLRTVLGVKISTIIGTMGFSDGLVEAVKAGIIC